METLETIRIVHPDDPNDYLIINAADFDPAIHKEYVGDDEDSGNSSIGKSESGESQDSPDTSSDDNGEELKTREELEQLEWHELKDYANQFDITDRSREGLMRELAEVNKIAPSE